MLNSVTDILELCGPYIAIIEAKCEFFHGSIFVVIEHLSYCMMTTRNSNTFFAIFLNSLENKYNKK